MEMYIYISPGKCVSAMLFQKNGSLGCGNSSGIHGPLCWEFMVIHGNSWAFMSLCVAGYVRELRVSHTFLWPKAFLGLFE